ncbi:MAG: acryloyl-CoA reductase [Gammaproteobacteria bacterium TMED104]|nr:MAG: acryloyl-CoA reductase [Gammaproteobacteria bacterium TMED104]|tara:strand:+ start:1563 stop:2555 length:993 start_codon:yes stop_codon:yes gene_type:complete
MPDTYNAFVIDEIEDQYNSSIKSLPIPELQDGSVLIDVLYSSLNYKDALSASGNKGVTKSYPFTPGIDAVGKIRQSKDNNLKEGDKVIVTGYDLGMNTNGGFGEIIHVPSGWVVPLPDNLSMEEAISFGTAGITAAASVDAVISKTDVPELPVVVSGATGGVGSIAVGLLSKLSIDVTAITGKQDSSQFLKDLGAKNIILRDDFCSEKLRPLDKTEFSAGVDTVGGEILSRIISQVDRHGVVTCCGNVNSIKLETTVFPFILRGIALQGIDSAESPISYKQYLWNKIASDWQIGYSKSSIKIIKLNELAPEIDKILNGNQQGRVVVKHGE